MPIFEKKNSQFMKIKNIDFILPILFLLIFGGFGSKIMAQSENVTIKKGLPIYLSEKASDLDWKQDAIYGGYKQMDELLNRRTRTSKTFRNQDGSYSSIISSGSSLHFMENGIWTTISREIKPNSNTLKSEYPYSNLENCFKTYYPASSDNKGVLIDIEESNLNTWIDPVVGWMNIDGSVNKLSEGLSSIGNVTENKILYKDVFNGTDIQFVQNQDGHTMNIEIKNKNILNNIPTTAKSVAIGEKFVLPDGWSLKTETSGSPKNSEIEVVKLFDKNNQNVVTFAVPHIFEKNQSSNKNFDNELTKIIHIPVIYGNFFIQQKGNVITLWTLVPIAWITASDRQFPVVVASSIECFPENRSNSVGYIQNGSKLLNGVTHGIKSSWDAKNNSVKCLGFAQFNLDAIPDASAISNANLILTNSTLKNARGQFSVSRANANLNTKISGAATIYADLNSQTGDIYESANSTFFETNTKALTTELVSASLGLIGNTDIQNNLADNIFTVGLYPFHQNQSLDNGFYTFGGADCRLLVKVTYTPTTPLAPTTADCLDAISVCANSYTQAAPVSGIGNYADIDLNHGCLSTNEHNSTWYTFKVQNSGNFAFTVNSAIDYDWALYNLSNNSCSDILSGAITSVRCNYSATTGNTGMSSSGVNASEGALGSVWCTQLAVTAGQTFALLVDKYAAGATGYSLTFTGTAGVVDNTGPSLANVHTPITCGASSMTFEFSEYVACSSVNVTDLLLTGPGGPYTLSNLQGLECNLGATNGKTFTATVSPALTTSGSFTLSMVGSVTDACANPTNTTVNLPFSINNLTITTNNVTNPTCFGASNGSITVAASNGTPTYSYSINGGAYQASGIFNNLSGGTYTINAKDGNNCSVSTSSIVLASYPALSGGTVGADQALCSGGNPSAFTSSASPSGGYGAVNLQWQKDVGCTGVFVDIPGATSSTYDVPAGVSQTTCYRRKATDNCTTAYSNIITVSVNPSPTVYTLSGSGSYCSGGTGITISLSGSEVGVNYQVLLSGIPYGPAFPGTGAAVNSTLTDAGTYTIIGKDATTSCESVMSGSAIITVNSLPVPSIAGANAACANQSGLVYSTANFAGDTYVWIVTGGTITSGQNTNQINVVWGSAGIGTVKVIETNTATSCTATSAIYNVAVNAAPTPVVTGNWDVCENSSNSYSTPSIAGHSYVWTIAGGTINSGQGTNQINVNWSSNGTGTIQVIETIGVTGCAFTSSVYNVNVNSLPNPVVSGYNVYCALTDSVVYSTPNIPGHTYSWSITGGVIMSGQSSNQLTVAWGVSGAGTLQVTETNSTTGCSASSAIYNIIINPLPTPGISGNNSVCENETGIIYTTNGIIGNSYLWSITGGVITSQSSNSVTVNWGNSGSGTLSVVETVGTSGCSATSLTFNVIINSLPMPAIIGDSIVCANGYSVSYTTQNNAGYTYSWTVNGGTISSGQNTNQIFVNWGNPGAASVQLTETIILTGCSVITPNHNVAINVLPSPAIVGANNICANSTGISYSITNNIGNTYLWSVTGGTIVSGQNTNSILVDWNTSGMGTVQVTESVIATGCSITSSTYNVTLNALPQVTNIAYTNVSFCGASDGSITIAATGQMPLQYSVNGGTNFYVNGGLFTGLSAGVYPTIVKNVFGCEFYSDTIVIGTAGSPPAPTAGNNATYCSGESILDITTTGIMGATFTWYANPGLTSVLGFGPSYSPSATIGTTIYYVTQSTTCESSPASVTIVVNPLPTATISGTASICNSGTDSTLITVALTGQAPWNIVYNNGTNHPVNNIMFSPYTFYVHPLGNTTYTIIAISDGNMCNNAGTGSATITVNTLPTPSIGSNSPVCEGSALLLNAGGGLTYNWSGPNGFISGTQNPILNNISSNSAGLYSVTVTNSNGCKSSTNTNVLVNQVPVANAGADLSICLQSSIQLSASGGLSYIWNPSSGLNATNISNPFASPSSTTTYTVIATNAAGCTDDDDVIITVNQPPIANTGNNFTIPNGTSITLNAMASGGSGNYSYLWSPSAFLLNSNVQSPSTLNLNTSTVYTLTVTDNLTGCTGTDQLVVSVTGGVLTAGTIASPNTVCRGRQTQLTASGNGGSGSYTYNWSSNPTGFISSLSNPTVSPTLTTTYTVTVNDGFNTATSSVIVIVYANPNANAGADVVICSGSSTSLYASGGTSYTWSTGSSTQSAPVAPLSSSTYTVTVSNANGCSSTDNVTVSVNQSPSAITGTTQTICSGGNATIGAPIVTGNNYMWYSNPSGFSSNLANTIVLPTVTTTYYLVESNPTTGCSKSNNIVISVNQLTGLTAGTDVSICPGANTQLLANGGASYVWSPSNGLSGTQISNPVASPTVTTTYVVTITAANGCSGSDNIVVSVNSQPIANAGIDAMVCVGTSTQLVASGGIYYSWNPSTGLSGTSISNPIANPTITITYTVVVSDNNLCTSTDNVVVVVNPLPAASAGMDKNICMGTSVALFGAGGLSYSWNNGVSNGVAFVPLATSSYVVTVTDINGCAATDNVVVFLTPQPSADAGVDQTICLGNSVTFNATGGANYTWSNGVFNGVPFSPVASSQYVVTVTDAGGCSASDVVSVTVNTPGVANAGDGQTICSGSSAQLNATAANTYEWSPSLGLSSTSIKDPISSPSTSVTYTLLVTDLNGCTASDNVVVTVNPSPQAIAGDNRSYCEGTETVINGSGGGNYLWSNGATTPTIIVTPKISTTYILTVTAPNGCTNTDDVIISITPAPIINLTILGDSNLIYEGQMVTFIAQPSGFNNYEFLINNITTQSGSSNTFNINTLENDQIITVIASSQSCKDEDTMKVKIKKLSNAFIPGNGSLFLKGLDATVVNRWGQQLYHGTEGWDGKTNTGNMVSPGTYFYIIKLVDENGTVSNVTGSVNLFGKK